MEEVFSQFVDTGPVLTMAPLGKGNINDTFKVEFRGENGVQSAVLQKINHRIFPHIENLCQNWDRVAAHLNLSPTYGLKAPRLWTSKADGGGVFSRHGRRLLLACFRILRSYPFLYAR